MNEYHKIDTCYKRNPENLKRLIEGDWANPAFGYLANNRWVFTEKVDGCLHYANEIDTDQGRLPIGRIVEQQLPVLVASYNTTNEVVEYKSIEHFHKESKIRPFLSLTLQSRGKGNRAKTIVCTDNHKFYSGGNWIEADSLSDGMLIAHSEDKLTEEQRQVILGGLLGDSHICRPSSSTRSIALGHSAAQAEYLAYKQALLGRLGNTINHELSRGYAPGTPKVRMSAHITKATSSLIIALCEENGKKRVTQAWCDEMLPLGLAIWYMDDGSCHFPTNQRPRANFATHAFDDSEVKCLLSMLRNRFGIKADVFDHKGNVIVLSADGTERLFHIVAPYISTSMKYKIAKRYASMRFAIPELPDAAEGIVEAKVLKISHSLPDRFARQQNYQYDLTIEGNSNYFTHRILVHNTNIRVIIPHKNADFDPYNESSALERRVAFGGKTDNASIPATLVTHLQNKFLPMSEKLFEMFPDSTCLYGEGYGAKIQKGGGNYRQDQSFVLFDVLVGDFWLERNNIEDVAQKLGLDVVPIINKGTLHDMVAMARTGFTSTWGSFTAEGIVARPEVELKNRSGKRIITKIKHRDFSTGSKHEDSITR